MADSAAVHPFVAVEAALQRPACAGMFVTYVTPDGPAASAGLQPCDIITTVGGKEIRDQKSLIAALHPEASGAGTHAMTVQRNGDAVALDVPASMRGFLSCAVEAGVPAWSPVPDTAYAPDFSALADGTKIFLRNGFGDAPAGYEIIEIRHRNGHLDVDLSFHIGGDAGPGETWDYLTRASATLAPNKTLSCRRTAFWEGDAKETRLRGDVEAADDGHWRGTHSRDGEERPVEFANEFADILTGYMLTLLPLTMPLHAGASLTVTLTGDGNGRPTSRVRLSCEGQLAVTVEGKEELAWAFVQHGYGAKPLADCEHFFVSDDRRLVRIEWGPGYGGCWSELTTAERLTIDMPPHVLAALRR